MVVIQRQNVIAGRSLILRRAGSTGLIGMSGIRRAAAGLVVGATLLAGTSRAQLPCLTTATAPIRNWVQDYRYGSHEIQRSTDEVRLQQRRADLERRASLLARQYAEYNADVTTFVRYNFARQSSASLYLPQSSANSGFTGANEPWPNAAPGMPVQSPAFLPAPQANAAPQQLYAPVPSFAPVQQPFAPAAPAVPAYPPVPTQVLPQPGATNAIPRDTTLVPGVVDQHTAQLNTARGF